MYLAKGLEAAGCALLVVHGRTRHEMKGTIADCDWAAIGRIKDALSIPVFANGGIMNAADVERCIEQSGTDGVMSSEGILENPGLFSSGFHEKTGLTLNQVRVCLELCSELHSRTSVV